MKTFTIWYTYATRGGNTVETSASVRAVDAEDAVQTFMGSNNSYLAITSVLGPYYDA